MIAKKKVSYFSVFLRDVTLLLLLNIVYILLKQQLLANITCAEMVLSNNHAAVSNWKNSVASFISLARRFCNGLILRIHFSTAKTYRSKLIQVYFNLQKNVVVMAERNLFMQVKSLLKNEKVSISKEYNSNYYPHGHKYKIKMRKTWKIFIKWDLIT